MQKIPGIGDIPILGLLFKSKAAQKDQTELVVMITPEILPNNSRGVTPNLPKLQEPYLPPLTDQEARGAAAARVRRRPRRARRRLSAMLPACRSQGLLSPYRCARRCHLRCAAQRAAASHRRLPAARLPVAQRRLLGLVTRRTRSWRRERSDREQEEGRRAGRRRAAKREGELPRRTRSRKSASPKEQAKKDQEAAKKAEEAAAPPGRD